MAIDGALRWFRSGSVAHGTVNKPVTDADCGLVLDRRNERYATLGPDGALAARYRIQSVPTFAVFRGGKPVQQQPGAVRSETLLKMLSAA